MLLNSRLATAQTKSMPTEWLLVLLGCRVSSRPPNLAMRSRSASVSTPS